MRQTIKEIEVNVVYCWFLGLDLTDKVPHFSTFGKNYVRRFKDRDIFEQIFSRILEECIKHGLVKPKEVFVDSTNDDDNNNNSSTGGTFKEEKCSTSDPESGWFQKGEHKQVFAYSIEAACDKHGWIFGYTVNRGNLHNSRTFKGLYDKIKNTEIETIIAYAGYKTPAIAKLLIDDDIKPLFPYKRPQTKDRFLRNTSMYTMSRLLYML